VPGLTVSPHILSRGNVARSTIRTRTPARAKTVAATLPAGPAPTITTSSTTARVAPPPLATRSPSHASHHNGTVLRSEAETVAERGIDFGDAAGIRDEVEIARRVRRAEIDRGRQQPAIDRQSGGHDAGCAAGTLRVADHRLHRRSGDPIRMATEQ